MKVLEMLRWLEASSKEAKVKVNIAGRYVDIKQLTADVMFEADDSDCLSEMVNLVVIEPDVKRSSGKVSFDSSSFSSKAANS